MNWGFWSPFFLGIALGWNSLILLNGALDNTYKDGQIDAINGKVKYELQKQDDNTSKWVYIK